MRVFAVIVGGLAAAFGGAVLTSFAGWINWQMLLTGWMPLLIGGGLAFYALFKGRDTPFHCAAKFAVWFIAAGFAAYAGFMVYLLFAYPVH